MPRPGGRGTFPTRSPPRAFTGEVSALSTVLNEDHFAVGRGGDFGARKRSGESRRRARQSQNERTPPNETLLIC